ncbi:MAG: FtsW/RodA/SpoVE family cell cycle protein [Tissierellia bacterium]|nr:FtsW/RodA/SpoVE family cell cycle protein [Tissierellia bacterium]
MINMLLKKRRPRDLLLAFELLAIFLLFLLNNNHIDKYIIILFLGLILILYISNFVLGRVSSGDNYIFLIVSMLLTIGIITIYRLNPAMGLKQLLWSLIGILVFYLTYFAVRAIRKLEYLTLLYFLGCVVFFIVTLTFASVNKGSKNWISLTKNDSVTIQLSEFTKILLMFLIASYYTIFQKRLEKQNIKYSSYILMGIMYLFVFFLFLQTDLGTAAVFMAIYTGLQFIYDKDRFSILVNFGLMIVGGIIGYFMFAHVRTRVDIWLHPWAERNMFGYGQQIVQSLFAIGEGGFFGSGIGLGYPREISYVETDVIFSAICEEMGIFTGIGIIMLFMLLTYRAIKIALNQEYTFYRILAVAIAILICIQCFLNIGGVIKLIPMTGITLPFVSYGGSSMVSSFMALGILQVTSEDMSYKYERSRNYENK